VTRRKNDRAAVKARLLIFALLASVVLNAALGFLLFKGVSAPRAQPVAAAAPTAAVASAPAAIDAAVWAGLRPTDLTSLVAQLRAEGFPPNVVRAIVSAQLTAAFAERRKAIDPEDGRRPFWKNQPPDAKVQIAFRQLDREQEKMLRQLLGDDARESDDLWSRRQRRDAWMAELPPEKAAAVKRIRGDFDEQRYDLYMTGLVPAETRAKVEALGKAQRNAIEKLLSPGEFETYELRTSNTAVNLRSWLTQFDPSEQEFRSLYTLQRAFDERMAASRTDNISPEERQREYEAAHQQLREQFKAALGPQRFAEYDRATDSSYQQAARLVARLELPAEAVGQVWSVQKDAQEQAKKIREDRALSEQQRSAQLATLAAESTTKITTVIGARGFEAYKDNIGAWLVDLTIPKTGR
jgi:hypothetical protein